MNENDICRTFDSRDPDFNKAFCLVKEVIQLFDCNSINITLITNGGESNTSGYLKVLREIKEEYPNNNI